jgi:hypothetical protein
VGVAIYEQLHAADLDDQAASLLVSGAVPKNNLAQYRDLADSASTAHGVATGLAVAAGVAAVGGGALFVWSVLPGPDGAPRVAVSMAGSF